MTQQINSTAATAAASNNKAAMAISVYLLALALKSIPVGTGYAVWTGVGAVGTALLGIVLLGDPATWPRLACIGLIVAGIAGLKLVS
ncbi:Quaternary ammonium compound-resistance protein SugE [compost metagenome]